MARIHLGGIFMVLTGAVLTTGCPGSATRGAFLDDLIALETAISQGNTDSTDQIVPRLSKKGMSAHDLCALDLAIGRLELKSSGLAKGSAALWQVAQNCGENAPESASEAMFVLYKKTLPVNRVAAIQLLASLISRFPDTAHARAAVSEWTGAISVSLDDQQTANTALKLAEKVPGTDAWAHLMYFAGGVLARNEGYLASAIELYDRIPVKVPSHGLADDALLQIGRIHLAQGRYDDVYATVARIHARYEKSYLFWSYKTGAYPSADLLEGSALAQSGRTDEALLKWQRTISEHPDSEGIVSKALELQWGVYSRRNDTEKAAAILQTLVKDYPATKAGRFARRELRRTVGAH